jgi:flagellar capping protein FliD
MQHPFEALATEKKGYPQIRRILQAMDDAIAKGKLKLKRSRLDKAREQIEEILNKNSLIPLHESCSKAFSKREQLLASETVAMSKRRRTKLEERLNRLRKRKKLADSRMDVRERRYKTELEDIESQKKELENAVSEITNKDIRITL